MCGDGLGGKSVRYFFAQFSAEPRMLWWNFHLGSANLLAEEIHFRFRRLDQRSFWGRGAQE